MKRSFAGFVAVVENPAGSVRKWRDAAGRRGETRMRHDYGYLKGAGTKGPDGDELDCYLGPDERSDWAFVVHQLDEAGRWDEDKLMLGFKCEADAREAYLAHRDDGDRAYGGMTSMKLSDLRAKIARRMGDGKIRHEVEMDWPARVGDRVRRGNDAGRVTRVGRDKSPGPWRVTIQWDKSVERGGESLPIVETVDWPDGPRGRTSGEGVSLMDVREELARGRSVADAASAPTADAAGVAEVQKERERREAVFKDVNTSAVVSMRVEQRGSKWVVMPESGDRVLGEHDTEEEALAQLRAIEASKHQEMAIDPAVLRRRRADADAVRRVLSDGRPREETLGLLVSLLMQRGWSAADAKERAKEILDNKSTMAASDDVLGAIAREDKKIIARWRQTSDPTRRVMRGDALHAFLNAALRVGNIEVAKEIKSYMRSTYSAFEAARGPDGKVRAGVWDRVCVPGEDFKDGQSTEFTLETLSQMAENFERRGDRVPLDYNHQSSYARENGQPAPALAFYGALAVVSGGKVAKLARARECQASGNEDGLDLSRDGLYAFRAEVTELGDRLLPNFRYLSPTFTPQGTERDGTEVGYCLAAVAATNTPWQPGTEIAFAQNTACVDCGAPAKWRMRDDRTGTSVPVCDKCKQAEKSSGAGVSEKDFKPFSAGARAREFAAARWGPSATNTPWQPGTEIAFAAGADVKDFKVGARVQSRRTMRLGTVSEVGHAVVEVKWDGGGQSAEDVKDLMKPGSVGMAARAFAAGSRAREFAGGSRNLRVGDRVKTISGSHAGPPIREGQVVGVDGADVTVKTGDGRTHVLPADVLIKFSAGACAREFADDRARREALYKARQLSDDQLREIVRRGRPALEVEAAKHVMKDRGLKFAAGSRAREFAVSSSAAQKYQKALNGLAAVVDHLQDLTAHEDDLETDYSSLYREARSLNDKLKATPPR